MRDSDQREVGTPFNYRGITPAMIEMGVKAFRQNVGEDGSTLFSLDAVVEAILKAALGLDYCLTNEPVEQVHRLR